jgi:Domain of unknown function (DUF397)
LIGFREMITRRRIAASQTPSSGAFRTRLVTLSALVDPETLSRRGTIVHIGGTTDIGWHRSRRCETGGCVEARRIGDEYALRDSVNPGPVLHFSVEAWVAFTAQVRAGEFDVR